MNMTADNSGGSPGPIAVALDAPDEATLARWVRASAPYVSTFKVGLEVFLREGADAVHRVRAELASLDLDRAVFLDLKLHDIPATVGGAARSIAPLQPDFLTVHASGGPEMISAAVQQLPQTRITAVTVLTSLGAHDLHRLGLVPADIDPAGPADLAVELVVRWASVAVEAGAGAIVCSPQEVAHVRAAVPDDVVLITPGVRPSGAAMGDQQRVATPASAIRAGADLLVIGRPITGADDPAAAAAMIAAECAGVVPSAISTTTPTP